MHIFKYTRVLIST